VQSANFNGSARSGNAAGRNLMNPLRDYVVVIVVSESQQDGGTCLAVGGIVSDQCALNNKQNTHKWSPPHHFVANQQQQPTYLPKVLLISWLVWWQEMHVPISCPSPVL